MKIDDSELLEVIYSPVCARCQNLIDGPAHKCRAFDKIPQEIWDGKNKHTAAYPGDHGIRFEAKKK